MFNTTSEQLPNPFTPLAFFPAELAYQIAISTYVLVGSVSVLAWDILTNLHTDLKILSKHPLNISIVVYFISRFGSLAYLLGLTVLQTSPVGHCENLHHIQILYPIIIPATSLLFFVRIRALYFRNSIVVAFFLFMWVAVIGASLTPTQGVSATKIGPTNYCINSRLEPYVAAGAIIVFVNDTLIFGATSWQLMRNSYPEPGVKNGVTSMMLGRHLPAFSRSLLQDGQAYYLTTITLNLVTASLFFNRSISVVYRSVIGVPNIVLMNSMACHVYRKIKLGVYREFPTSDNSALPSALVFNGGPSGNSGRSGNHETAA